MHFVYFAKNQIGHLYVGISQNVEQRLYTHNAGHGALFTRGNLEFKIVFLEEYNTLKEARTREVQIKKWRRDKKDLLIQRFKQGLLIKQS